MLCEITFTYGNEEIMFSKWRYREYEIILPNPKYFNGSRFLVGILEIIMFNIKSLILTGTKKSQCVTDNCVPPTTSCEPFSST